MQTIIVLLHEGGFQSGTYQDCAGISGPIVDIAENLHPEIDLVVTGHTHQPYICNIPDPAGRKRMVTSASSFGRVVTETTLTISTKTGEVKRNQTTATNHLVTRTDPDPVQTEIISRWDAAAAPIANRVVGTITADLIRSPNRDTESTLANRIADAQLAATAAAGDGGAQIAFMNPGGVRADLTVSDISGGEQPGEVTYGEAFDVQPFGNLLVTMDLTGAQIEQLLEQQAIDDRPGGREVLIFGVSEGFAFAITLPERSAIGSIRPASSWTASPWSRIPATGSSPTASWPTAATRSPCSPKGPTESVAVMTWWPSPSTSMTTPRSLRPRTGSSASDPSIPAGATRNRSQTTAQSRYAVSFVTSFLAKAKPSTPLR